MATQDAQSSRTAGDGLTAVASPPVEPETPEKNSRWFVELSEVLQPLSLTGENALHFIGVVILGSFGMAYWGAYTEHFYVGAISAIVFLLAMVAWGIVTCWRVWAVINGSVRWWRSRRRGATLANSGAG